MPRIKEQAICIRHLDWSETSQVVVLLTENHGKVRGLAKGSKRLTPSSVQRFSGGIELLTRGEIVWVARQGSELATLTEWDLQDDFHHLRRDLGAHRLAMYAADVLNAVLADHDSHPRSYAALRALLESLRDVTDEPARQAALLRFQWVVLEDAGYRPELFHDAVSGGNLTEGKMYSFDPKAGGLTNEARIGGQDWRVRRATVDALRSAATSPDAALADADAVARANKLLCVYLRAILDQELPTMKLLLEAPAPARAVAT